ncbi:MAG: lysine--tRNA ligase, partial [Pseudomonadota bacterium]
KSSGNGISIDEWLSYAATESLSYFMYQKPKTAKRLYFDVIPRAVDEYHQQLRAYPDQEEPQKVANPVHHIHNGDVPTSNMVIPFAMLLNLASVSSAQDKDKLWGFIQRYAPDTSPETNPDMDQAAGFAVRYFQDFVAPTRTYRAATDTESEALQELRDQLASYDGEINDEDLQSVVYAVGRDRFDPLRDWFKAIYEVLLGASQGPRFGGFIALYGVEETIALIDDALAGKLTQS